MIRDFSEIKPSDIKMYLVSLIDSVDKLYNSEEKHIDDSLKTSLTMSDKQIYFYKQILHQNFEKINKFKFKCLFWHKNE